MKCKILGALGAITALSMSTQASAQGCSIELLDEIEAGWLSAIEHGMMGKMKLGEFIRYKENFKNGSLGAFLEQPRKVDWHLTLKDTEECKIFVESVLLGGDKPQVAATHVGNSFFGVGPFDNITSAEGDWLFSPEKTLEYAQKEDWFVIPEADRSSREELIAAADAYLDLFDDPSVEVPWGYPCNRLEGGIYTGSGEDSDTCNLGIPEGGTPITDRVYVVDTSIGAVNVFVKFGVDELPDSHTFRVENGTLRYIHTVTNCKGLDNCGFPPLPEGFEID